MRAAAWLGAMALVAVALAAVPAPAAERRPKADSNRDDVPEAELLLNLDLLTNSDLARDRKVLGRSRLGERLRLLDLLPMLDPSAPGGAAAPAAKETK